MKKIPYKAVAFGVVWLVAWGVVLHVFVRVHNMPKDDPDRVLRIEQKVMDFFQQVTLPIKLAKLRSRPADTQILMPVHGRRISEIADTWSAPRGEGRSHEGQDIFANRGTPVFAGTAGYATRVDVGDLGGNFVYITGAGGARYYYAHLDRFADGISIGDWVTTDTVIGFVGNTGNAENTPSHLHFGMYVSREAVNPLPLLVNR
jgi:murein DD-endopeptidase MepM/ murein hydrolase activator NlpD